MEDQNWLRIGVIALAVVGLLFLIGVAIGSGDGVEGETWVAQEMMIDGTPVQPISGTVLTATFEDGSLNGVAGCNNYFTGYQTDGNSIEIGPIASTQVFCAEPEGTMDQEFAYLGLLQTANEYERDGDRLTLQRDGTALITYSAAQAELADG